jgi:DNA invertase Pin-like site-specific DNA recombinase
MDMKTSVIYARVSSIGDRQSTSRQVADLTQYATTNGMAVTEIFEEHISGAVKNEERPVLCECLDYCIANGIDTLLISELSRLGRNVDEVLANVKRCKENNLNIYFQRENISIFQADGSKNPFLNIFISVLGTCAEMEREAVAFRLNSGLKRYKENGGKVGRKVGSIKTKEQKQEEYAKVLRCLKQGKSIRDTSVLCDVSVSTVFRVKREFGV